MHINVLTRTSNRPYGFSRCRESVLNQTHKDITHIVSYDNPDDLEYLNTYEEIRKVRVDQAQLLADWKEDGRNPTEIPAGGAPFSPHNLYCNVLLDSVEDGWIMFLDDDDTLCNPKAFEEIISHIKNEDSLVYWQMRFPDGGLSTTQTFARGTPVLCDIGSPCFMFHSKWKNYSWWDQWKCCDFRFVSRLHRNIPNKEWILKPYVQVGGFGLGKREDYQKGELR